MQYYLRIASLSTAIPDDIPTWISIFDSNSLPRQLGGLVWSLAYTDVLVLEDAADELAKFRAKHRHSTTICNMSIHYPALTTQPNAMPHYQNGNHDRHLTLHVSSNLTSCRTSSILRTLPSDVVWCISCSTALTRSHDASSCFARACRIMFLPGWGPPPSIAWRNVHRNLFDGHDEQYSSQQCTLTRLLVHLFVFTNILLLFKWAPLTMLMACSEKWCRGHINVLASSAVAGSARGWHTVLFAVGPGSAWLFCANFGSTLREMYISERIADYMDAPIGEGYVWTCERCPECDINVGCGFNIEIHKWPAQ